MFALKSCRSADWLRVQVAGSLPLFGDRGFLPGSAISETVNCRLIPTVSETHSPFTSTLVFSSSFSWGIDLTNRRTGAPGTFDLVTRFNMTLVVLFLQATVMH